MRPARMTPDDIDGVVGILPTPATADAARWDATFTVDLDETARMTEAMVGGDVDVLMTTGTFGEGATLTWPELEGFVGAVADAAAGRIPVFAGVTTLNTRDTIRRGRALMDLGVAGLFVGRPMWLPLDDRGIVRFYRDLTEALPGVPIVVYDAPGAFKGKISPAAYSELSAMPEIIAAKHLGLLLGGGSFVADLQAVQGRMRLLPLENDWYYVAQLFPDQAGACWSGNVACGPAPVVRLRDAVRARDWDASRRLTEEIDWALEPLFPNGSFEAFHTFAIQLDKAQFDAAGFVRAGPPRAPYIEAPDHYVEGARESGRRWAQLQQRYGAGAAVA